MNNEATQTVITDLNTEGWIGAYCFVETRDGSTREGKVTAVFTKTFEATSDEETVTYSVPYELELNGEPIDRINFLHIKKMRLK